MTTSYDIYYTVETNDGTERTFESENDAMTYARQARGAVFLDHERGGDPELLADFTASER